VLFTRRNLEEKRARLPSMSKPKNFDPTEIPGKGKEV
jgi:hypothetical protein